MRKFLVVLAMLSGLLAVRGAAAVEVQGVYEAQVPVATQQRDDRTVAIRLALTQVLVKASGRSDAASIPDIDQVLAQASRYVEQFRYRRTPPFQEGGTENGGRLYLWVRFEANAIDNVLRSHDLPVWGRVRPTVLVWLAVQSQGRRQLIGVDSQGPSHNFLLSEAARRGLPLRLPLLDLTDQAQVTASDVWGGFQDTLLQAAKRYQADGVLIGQVYQDANGMWHANWTLFEQGEHQSWTAQGGALAEVIDPGVDQSANILSQRFAQVLGGSGDTVLLLRVNGVTSLADYTRVVNYLSALVAVKAADPVSLGKEGVILRLTVRGDRIGLIQAISLGHTLGATGGGSGTGNGTGSLVPTQTPAPALVQLPVSAPAPAADVQVVAGPVPELIYRLLP